MFWSITVFDLNHNSTNLVNHTEKQLFIFLKVNSWMLTQTLINNRCTVLQGIMRIVILIK